ncbi:ATP-citrate synthase-like isoform X2 [Dysidea avara]|uniref:ATP-citrate synthase-like isoform X2 n=1 Tax=Dysidea avara TaxID=196820 RepID=UPI00331F956B
MSAKAIREYDGKTILAKYFDKLNRQKDTPTERLTAQLRSLQVTNETDIEWACSSAPWINTQKLVVKPDQLIKRRGKLGLIKVDANLAEVKEWLSQRMGNVLQIGSAVGKLNTFIVEPFLPHEQADEFYVCIFATRTGNTVYFYHEGGVDIGDVDSKAEQVNVHITSQLSKEQANKLLAKVAEDKKSILVKYLQLLYQAYSDLYFTYLEVNPLVVKDGKIHMLDLAAKLDSTAEYLCKINWGDVEFPPPFGRDALPEEAHIAELDAKSGASLKLTILNKKGTIWTMVAGGGASVIYSDTVCDLGGSSELANYGEYSGAPSESQTYDYAKTILSLMTEEKNPKGKVLIIGGGIANFTNVAATFKGIVRALSEYKHKLVENKVSIYVRRGGPNYQEGLRLMADLGSQLGVPLHVYGPESHMTAIVAMALGKRKLIPAIKRTSSSFSFGSPPGSTGNLATTSGGGSLQDTTKLSQVVNVKVWSPEQEAKVAPSKPLFTASTKAVIWGMQPRACQGMLDFDFLSSRKTPSVVAMIYPFSGNHKHKLYWGHEDIMIPVYKEMSEAFKRHPDADVLVNFASLRSAYESTMEAMQYPQIRSISIIAEGIPENKTKLLIQEAEKKGVSIIGPATVGGIKPGCFKIGNTGGMVDNILDSKLYRPGCVAYVSRSGGMSNELNNIIMRNTNGVYEGVAIGGDRYPGTSFADHIFRYNDDPNVKMMVLLGEVGGVEEYIICEALKSGRLFKPLVAWCIGTCANMFSSEVQFGHAGASANSEKETAIAKNKALREAGAYVPDSFDTLGAMIGMVYNQLVSKGVIAPLPETAPPTIPMDYNWARELGLIRKPANFMTSISDERGEELLYAGMPISDVFKDDIGIGGVMSLLWFQRRLPDYACKFLEICLMVSADHGPAVSGAHNTIVTARAGKDLVSSLTSGLLTIGDRFGGALDGAAKQFSEAYDSGIIPMDFVNKMRKEHNLIMGIGHRVKSLNNPDMRVVIIKEYVKKHFPSSPMLDYALQVEKITTAKKPNLILNVDGVIATSFVDLIRNCGAFTREEATEYIEIGSLNGLFVLGRTMGFIGHYLDQKRLKQGLYRHPWDDISYLTPDVVNQ